MLWLWKNTRELNKDQVDRYSEIFSSKEYMDKTQELSSAFHFVTERMNIKQRSNIPTDMLAEFIFMAITLVEIDNKDSDD